MKISWGVKIAATYIFFVVAVLVLVVIFMNQDVGLVTKDYYAKEIKYQEQIDKENRAKELPEQLNINLESGIVKLSFPKIFRPTEIGGTIQFYRPADKTKDFAVNITLDSTHTQSFRTTNLEKGLWKVQVDWNAKGNTYFNEKIIMTD
ncbi:MAG: FixH family protein [Bacteroidetes bacterium]|nr:FixH family protein [Bacteroidota bacterium]